VAQAVFCEAKASLRARKLAFAQSAGKRLVWAASESQLSDVNAAFRAVRSGV
jgi:hypothetical protein